MTPVKLIKLACCVILLVFFVTGFAYASDYEDGYDDGMDLKPMQNLNSHNYIQGYYDGMAKREELSKGGSRKRRSSGNSIKDPGPCLGDCGAEQGICISQCQGDGNCLSRCYSSHGRCVSRCH